VVNIADTAKRLLVGRALRSAQLHETLLPKRIALPIFASDPLSSVAYATQEILLVLTVGGLAYLWLTPWVATAVVLLMAVVVASYQQVVRAYPSGGGSYEVASRNLGDGAGLVVAGALMIDYVMTVAVSVAAGVDNIISAMPSLHTHRVLLALSFVVLLTIMNLRGVRESGRAFALPTYAFIAGVFLMVGLGLGQTLLGSRPVAESAGWDIRPEHTGIAGLALVVLALRAFSSGCTALTGVEAISNGVPAFRKPKSTNAAQTMLAMGVIAITMFSGVTALALISRVRIAEDTCNLAGFPGDCTAEPQRTVIAQIAAAVFGGHNSILFFYIQAATAAILILAANTAYNGFPQLTSILAQHRFMPRQLHTRGDRLTYSNGILLLALVAGILLYAYDASVTRLIHLYILGVFTSFTLSQAGMVRHWNRLLRDEADPAGRRTIRAKRLVNGAGGVVTGLVLVVVTATKFMQGAYLVVIAVPVLFFLMRSVRAHYDSVSRELTVAEDESLVLPSRIHAIVLVSKIHKPTLQALAFARATRPSVLEAVTVNIDPEETRALQQEWDRRAIPVPLKVLDSPYREITRPIIEYAKSVRRDSPRDIVTVFIPEYVVGHWWEQILHNQSALRLKARLLFTPGVMVINVPWQLRSSALAAARPERPGPGQLRRGEVEEERPRTPTAPR